jgi:hypothetical protein
MIIYMVGCQPVGGTGQCNVIYGTNDIDTIREWYPYKI